MPVVTIPLTFTYVADQGTIAARRAPLKSKFFWLTPPEE